MIVMIPPSGGVPDASTVWSLMEHLQPPWTEVLTAGAGNVLRIAPALTVTWKDLWVCGCR